MPESSEQVNPLPEFHANAELQRQSVHALYAMTKSHGLLLRADQPMDHGVDATLEVVVGNRATNYTAQVQIKAVQSAELNSDGSVSKQIDVSNLNYLLNGQCPIYLLYAADEQRFWYSWAFDEYRRLEEVNPRWREQDSVTVRFSRPLDDAALTEVHAKIIKESQYRRELVDTLARCVPQESAKVLVHPQTLHVDNADRAYESLLSHGFTFISGGKWCEVLDQFCILTLKQRADPRICIVAAYAHYAQGRCVAAFGYCGEALLRVAELDRSHLEMLEVIRDACECVIGRITREEYTSRQSVAAEVPGASAQRRFEALRFELLAERDDGRRTALLAKFTSFARQILSDDTNSEGFKLQTKVQLAYIEGWELHLAITRSIGALVVQDSLELPWIRPDRRALTHALSQMASWAAHIQELVEEADATGIKWLCAEARRTAILLQTAILSQQRFQFKFFNIGISPNRSDAKDLVSQAEFVAKLFSEAGNIEGEMRAKLAVADIYEIVDDDQAAKDVAAEVKSVADALGSEEIKNLANQHLTGSTILKITEASILKGRAEGSDVDQAAMTPKEIDDFAEQCRRASQLPLNRLPAMRREAEAMKAIAAERLHWCRHLQQIQNLVHMRHPATAYAVDPERFGKCLKHGYESLQGNTDASVVTACFKKAYCEDCSDRSPKLIGKS